MPIVKQRPKAKCDSIWDYITMIEYWTIRIIGVSKYDTIWVLHYKLCDYSSVRLKEQWTMRVLFRVKITPTPYQPQISKDWPATSGHCSKLVSFIYEFANCSQYLNSKGERTKITAKLNKSLTCSTYTNIDISPESWLKFQSSLL